LRSSLRCYLNKSFVIGIFGFIYSISQLPFKIFRTFGGGFRFVLGSTIGSVFLYAKTSLYATFGIGAVDEPRSAGDGDATDEQTKDAVVRLPQCPVSSKISARMATRFRPWKLDSSAADCVSTITPSIASSFIKERSIIKLIILYILAIGCLTFATAAPTESEAVTLFTNGKCELVVIEREGCGADYAVMLGISKDLDTSAPESAHALQNRQSAGLAWGPVSIGNLKLSLTNPHDGYAGPKFPNANHVNFHVDKQAPRNSWDEVVNMHIVKYTFSGQPCLYAWDSVTKQVAFDSCFDDFSTAIGEAVTSVKDFVDALLQAADFIAAVAIIAALAIALVAALGSLGVVAVA